MKHTPAHRAPTARTARWTAAAVVAAVSATALLIPSSSADAAASTAPTVKSLNVRSGGSWGADLVTIKGTNFTGSSAVGSVLFGSKKADGFDVVNSTTIQAYSPEVTNKRQTVDVRVVLRNGTKSAASSADRFTFVVPTMNTRLNGHWSAAQSRSIANSMLGKAARVNAQAVAHNPGYWTAAMGRSALKRAQNWLGMPYTWAGGNASGPTYGSCYGDGLIGKFDCKFQGFDCSGLTLYAWAKYKHLDHYAATQKRQAGSFHPSVNELAPGDLLFFSTGGSTISHVVMYSGGGNIIQASESGWPLRYSTLAQVMASHPRYFGATRPMSRTSQVATPTVTSVSTATSAIGGGSTVTLHGSHLDTTSRVFFGSTSTYAFSVKSASTITVKVPAHAAGGVSVRVANAWAWSPSTTKARMTYIGAPTLTSASPSTGVTTGGTTVRLTGKNFVTGTTVTFGATKATSVKVLSGSTLSVVTPRAAVGRSTITVTSAFGKTSRTMFTFTAPVQPSPSPSSSSAPPTSPAPTPTVSTTTPSPSVSATATAS